MQKQPVRTAALIGILIIITCAAMAYSGYITPSPPPADPVQNKSGIVSLSGQLTQNKIFTGSDGKFSLELNLVTDDVLAGAQKSERNVDMVIVLDRSGSMEGQKINYARKSVQQLIERLSPKDRFALVSYSSGVYKHSGLLSVSDSNSSRFIQDVSRIRTGGGTNLGAGLQQGIALLRNREKNGNAGRLILISDGLANEGVTDPAALGRIASAALEHTFAVSTVGVGNDFNEQLMTSLADRGAGNYYYLENPRSFAEIFGKEFKQTALTAVTGLEISIPMSSGLSLADAAGYPIDIKKNTATFYPGDLRSGQHKKLFLTFQMPAHETAEYDIRKISARYQYNGENYTVSLEKPFRIACVKDPKEAFASIRKSTWEKKVLQDDYSRLRQDVAKDIKEGNEQEAMKRIETYQVKQQTVNEVVGSAAVEENITRDMDELRETVKKTFAGPKAEVAGKQKRTAKSLQFEAYKDRRVSKE